MTDTKGAVLPFPVSPASLRQPEFTRESPEADADIRASMLSDLLDRLANDQGNADSPTDLRQRIAAYMARDLLDEMVTLYRKALSEARRP